MKVETLSVLTLRTNDSRYYFFSQIANLSITVETDFRAVTELTFHRTSFLSGNSNNHLILKIYLLMGYTIDFLSQSKEVRLYVGFLAIVANI